VNTILLLLVQYELVLYKRGCFESDRFLSMKTSHNFEIFPIPYILSFFLNKVQIFILQTSKYIHEFL